VIGLYLAGTLGLSAWLARRQEAAADYYVGGRTLPWWALAMSILATQSSAYSFIGIPAYVALVPDGGLTWLQYELMLPLAMTVVMLVLVLVPVLRGLGVMSVNESQAAARERLELAGWSRPAFAEERPVYTRSPTFAFGPRRRQTAVTLNRLQRSSTCRALSFSARSLRSPLRSKMA
jgi:hypothetical protein